MVSIILYILLLSLSSCYVLSLFEEKKEKEKNQYSLVGTKDVIIPKCYYAACIDGYWSSWNVSLTGVNKQQYDWLTSSYSFDYKGLTVYHRMKKEDGAMVNLCYIRDLINATGNYDGFSITYAYLTNFYFREKWNYVFKFKIDNYSKPSEVEKKAHIENKKDYVYSGTVEYFIDDEHLNIKNILSQYKCPIVMANSRRGPVKKITSKATIIIAPYEDEPYYYIFKFNNVAFALLFEYEVDTISIYKRGSSSDCSGINTKKTNVKKIIFYD